MPLDSYFYYKKDRLNQVRGFCAAVKCDCSQAKAAKELNVEPATVNKQIASLERDLKIKLFKRENNHKLSLTSEGKTFYDEISTTVQQLDGIFEDFCSRELIKREEEIRIAAHHTICCYLIPHYIKEFKNDNCETKFLIKQLALDDSINELLANKVDIVLYPTEHTFAGCESILIYDLDPFILINKDNKLSIKKDIEITYKDLKEQNLMLIDENKILPYFKDICNKFKLQSYIKFQNANWELIRYYIKMDLGIHLYSNLYNLFPDFKDTDIVSKNVAHLFPRIMIYCIIKKDKIQTQNVQNFLKMIKDNF